MNASATHAHGEVASHFENAERQRATAQLGMWVFLATELMFFGPLFLSYAVGRIHFFAGFAAASRHTDVLIGTVNTAILLTSSLCMALAVRAAQLENRRSTIRLLLLTASLGVVFVALKGIEYYHEWQEHLIPWLDFQFDAANKQSAAYFYFVYFGMTGLHAVHLTIGILLMVVFATRLRTTKIQSLSTSIEMGGLYWHFVDAMWVFLYPIIYLVERHA